MTRDLYNLNLLANLMVLLRLILFNPAMATIVEAILMRVASVRVSPLHRVAPDATREIFLGRETQLADCGFSLRNLENTQCQILLTNKRSIPTFTVI